MGRRIACPRCGNEWWLHGRGTMDYQQVTKCYDCNLMFNPRKQSAIPEGNEA